MPEARPGDVVPEARPADVVPEARRDAQPDVRAQDVNPRNDLRASHEDRDRIVELLRVSAGDGRLSIDELDERVEAALTARTYGELEGLVADLPATPGTAAGALTAKPKEMVRIECHSGSAKRDGRWAVPQRMEVRVHSGSVTLDFTQAQVSWPTLQIDAEVRSGTLTLITKPGIVLDTDDVAVRSGAIKVKAPWGDGARRAGRSGTGCAAARVPLRHGNSRLAGHPASFRPAVSERASPYPGWPARGPGRPVRRYRSSLRSLRRPMLSREAPRAGGQPVCHVLNPLRHVPRHPPAGLQPPRGSGVGQGPSAMPPSYQPRQFPAPSAPTMIPAGARARMPSWATSAPQVPVTRAAPFSASAHPGRFCRSAPTGRFFPSVRRVRCCRSARRDRSPPSARSPRWAASPPRCPSARSSASRRSRPGSPLAR